MTKLYTKLARVYHEMYQGIFDYKKHFRFYNKILKDYNCQKILEIGCGSGNLSPYFLKAGFNYKGLDISKEMLAIAKEVEPKGKFIQGDMRYLKLKEKFDAILITGRSFTYMTTNDDVNKALKSINSCLKQNGILVFDNFDAEIIFGNFKRNIVQTSEYKGKEYKRISTNTPNLKTGWTWNWHTKYKIRENKKTKEFEDSTVLRAFTKDELKLFLKLNNFEPIKTTSKDGGITTIAKKKPNQKK